MEFTVTFYWWVIPAMLTVAWALVPTDHDSLGIGKALISIPVLAAWCVYLGLRVLGVIGS